MDTVRFLLDFGLFVLIWLVQLVIYPSFTYYAEKELVAWHKKYTQRFSFIVVPLMLGQLMSYGMLLQEIKSFHSMASFILVLLVWLLTFTIFVPKHKAISGGNYSRYILEDLVKLNWYRTAIWSVIFLWNLSMYF